MTISCSHVASVCSYVSLSVDTSFVWCFKEVDLENARGKLAVATLGLVVSEILPATGLISFHGHSNCFTGFLTGLMGVQV